MTPRAPAVYPKSNKECVALLKALGSKKKLGTGRGNHPEKYYHPKRRNTQLNDKPFVLVTHEYFDANGQRLMKKLRNWGFSPEELERVYLDKADDPSVGDTADILHISQYNADWAGTFSTNRISADGLVFIHFP